MYLVECQIGVGVVEYAQSLKSLKTTTNPRDDSIQHRLNNTMIKNNISFLKNNKIFLFVSVMQMNVYRKKASSIKYKLKSLKRKTSISNLKWASGDPKFLDY